MESIHLSSNFKNHAKLSMEKTGEPGGLRSISLSCSLAFPIDEGGCTSVLAIVQVSPKSASSVATDEAPVSLARRVKPTTSPGRNSQSLDGRSTRPTEPLGESSIGSCHTCIGLAGLRGRPGGEWGVYQCCCCQGELHSCLVRSSDRSR